MALGSQSLRAEVVELEVEMEVEMEMEVGRAEAEISTGESRKGVGRREPIKAGDQRVLGQT